MESGPDTQLCQLVLWVPCCDSDITQCFGQILFERLDPPLVKNVLNLWWSLFNLCKVPLQDHRNMKSTVHFMSTHSQSLTAHFTSEDIINIGICVWNPTHTRVHIVCKQCSRCHWSHMHCASKWSCGGCRAVEPSVKIYAMWALCAANWFKAFLSDLCTNLQLQFVCMLFCSHMRGCLSLWVSCEPCWLQGATWCGRGWLYIQLCIVL